MYRTCVQRTSAHGSKDACSLAISIASSLVTFRFAAPQVRMETNAATSTSASRRSLPSGRSRSPRLAVGSAGGAPLPAAGVPASVDSVGPQEQIADEVGHEDEEEPPDPPDEVGSRLHLAKLDHRQVERNRQREPHDERR